MLNRQSLCSYIYNVVVSLLSGVSDWQQSPQEVSKSWIGISHLEKGTSYEIRLSVTNGGNTATSEVETVETKGICKFSTIILFN